MNALNGCEPLQRTLRGYNRWVHCDEHDEHVTVLVVMMMVKMKSMTP